MTEDHIARVSRELSLSPKQATAVVTLLDEGATVPFIARYRKEATGSLDEVAITAIRDRITQLRELDKRREAVLKSLEELGKLTDGLKTDILAAETMTILEDLYLPYRPKRRTRATIAKEQGLEPLARKIFSQDPVLDPFVEAAAYIDPGKEVPSADDALAGARDIIGEWISEDPVARGRVRELFASKGIFRSKVITGKEEEGIKYKDYFAWEEPVAAAPSHRILAMRRGENEGFLFMRIVAPEPDALALLESLFLKGPGPATEQVRLAVHDGYKRLLSVSLETEMRLATRKRADEEAIRVFAGNVRQLLLAPPLGRRNILAVDPGFRTGCKIVCIDQQGALLQNDTIFPLFNEKGSKEAGEIVLRLCATYRIEAIAIGNGTAGRETEAFVRGLGLPKSIAIVMVSENGASVYSASDVAREEFPDHDVTVRGAISIGRRLMDPLAELVKIDPKSIGVGQYQHDVDQPALKRSLDDVVESCVNSVGVEVNTASKQLLMYVSGLGPQLAAGIVKHRNAKGPFGSREELRKVPKLGPKTFEQAAGFLRIHDAPNPLDASAVHPESYPIVDAMAKDLNCSVGDLMTNESLRKKIDLSRYVTDTVGLPTLQDIMKELARPGRDPRERFEAFSFAEGVSKMEDLVPGMTLPGIVTNIAAFGVFVDIGVHQDGLVHISELADRFVKDPNEVVKVHQHVTVTVREVDIKRKRIALTMKKGQGNRQEKQQAPKEEKADLRSLSRAFTKQRN